jgi:dipeptidyl aminopeptidase/acylaminoacyl peptidase
MNGINRCAFENRPDFGQGRFSATCTLQKSFRKLQLGENKLVTILSADGKTELAGRLILSVGFDPAKKYPVVVYVYGGPHSQMVNKGWLNSAGLWQYYMAAQGYIAFTMDNRGTLNRGREFETTIHRQLGIPETEDQMKGIEYLKSLPYVMPQSWRTRLELRRFYDAEPDAAPP